MRLGKVFNRSADGLVSSVLLNSNEKREEEWLGLM